MYFVRTYFLFQANLKQINKGYGRRSLKIGIEYGTKRHVCAIILRLERCIARHNCLFFQLNTLRYPRSTPTLPVFGNLVFGSINYRRSTQRHSRIPHYEAFNYGLALLSWLFTITIVSQQSNSYRNTVAIVSLSRISPYTCQNRHLSDTQIVVVCI